MNNNIKKRYPDATKQWAEFSSRAVTTFRDAYVFFDERNIFVTISYAPDESQQWGYEVRAGWRIIIESSRYDSRLAAEKAGFETAFEELNKLILAGNA